MKTYQFGCKENDVVDLRQANAVLRHRPDIIIFEAPTNGTPGLVYNRYSPTNKPLDKVTEHQKMLQRVSKKYPWVASDISVYENIKTLWSQGHDVKLYSVDGPSELLKVDDGVKQTQNPKPCRRGTYLLWWIRIYLREKIMTKNVHEIISKADKDAKILIFLEDFHWRNVKFQLSNPSKKDMWGYYFGSFRDLKQKDMKTLIKQRDRTLYKYWNRVSDFKN